MSLTPISLCSRALIKIGAAPMTSFDDGTAEAEVAAALYEPARDALLSANGWSFATRQARLAKVDIDSVADFFDVYQLPVDFLRALSAGGEGRGRGLEYQIIGNTLHTDSDSVILSYIARVDESLFPAFFTQGLITRLAAEFCIPLTENTSRAEALQQQAELEFRRARLIDAQQDTQPVFEDFSLIEARET